MTWPTLVANVAQTSLVHKKESSAYGHHDTVDDEARKDLENSGRHIPWRKSRTKSFSGCSRLNDILLGIWMFSFFFLGFAILDSFTRKGLIGATRSFWWWLEPKKSLLEPCGPWTCLLWSYGFFHVEIHMRGESYSTTFADLFFVRFLSMSILPLCCMGLS